ncbi:DNA-directed DNA polymerase [Tanacetum coccineum]
MGFKPTKQQVYQHVSEKPTANTSGNKKKNVEPTKEVSESNSFDMLNSVENDVELGTNRGTSCLASQEANYSGSSFWNVDSSIPSTTPIIEKIDKMEKLIIDGKVTLVDNEGKALKKVDDDSEDEVASVDNEMDNDDMYEGQEIPEKLQAFCDNLDIKVRGLSEDDDVAVSNSVDCLAVASVDNSLDVAVSSSNNTGCDSSAFHDNNASSSNSLKTPKSFNHHEFIDTPEGSVYWVLRVSASVLPVLGTVYDNIKECISMYRKYASAAGFSVRLSSQKRLRSDFMKHKYLVCNREGCPKKVCLNTLDPKKDDRQIRTSNFKICGCKARVILDLVPGTTKYTLTIFDLEHNHELDRIEYKHLSKAERNGLKGSSSLVHGTKTEFKNFTSGVNYFIGDNNAQMLVTLMEERQQYTKDFSFDCFVKDIELCGLFWADEVAKCNYKEFGDIYKMVFMPFTAIDNHRRCVTVGTGLLKKETTEAYGWLLRAFRKAFVCAPNIVVTDQDGAMRLAIAAEFPESKHRLCMWHIMQKIPSKIVSRIYDETDFKTKFSKIVWNMFIRPKEFEDRWNNHMMKFNLVNHKWLSKMFTTCEVYAMLPKVYTRNLFTRVQKEIVAGSWLCSIKAISSDDGCVVCVIDEEKPKSVAAPKVIDKESTPENVEEEINLQQKSQNSTRWEEDRERVARETVRSWEGVGAEEGVRKRERGYEKGERGREGEEEKEREREREIERERMHT